MVGSARSSDHQLISLMQLSREAGISRGTLVNWSRLAAPLFTHVGDTGLPLSNWHHLINFCRANAGRYRAAQKVLSQHSSVTEYPDSAPRMPDQASASVARTMRTAAMAHLDALIVATRQNEEMARAQREQLELIRTSFRAFDDALTEATVPGTLPD